MAANPLPPPGAIPVFIPSDGGEAGYAPVEATPLPVAAVFPKELPALTEEQKRSVVQLQDILGVHTDKPLAAVIPFPMEDDKGLVEAKTVEEAIPLIGNMIKAERAAGSVKKPYPRTALKHQHIVAFMLCNPFATTTEICSFFSISPTTLATVYKSDTFKSLVAAHRVSIDSGIGGDLQAQLRDTLAAAVEVVQKAVVEKQDPDFALEVLDKAANRLGMGAKHNTGPQVQVNIVTPEMIAAARASRSLR